MSKSQNAGSLGQLDKKVSEKVINVDTAPVATVLNLQIAAQPGNGDRFYITPYEFRFTSATAGWDNSVPYTPNSQGIYYMKIGANVSATYSAVSASINLAMAGSEGFTAAGAAGSRTDVALTAARPGNRVSAFVMKEATAGDTVITQTTQGNFGAPLPEGFTEMITSAGNKVRCEGPAEANFLRIAGRHPIQKV